MNNIWHVGVDRQIRHIEMSFLYYHKHYHEQLYNGNIYHHSRIVYPLDVFIRGHIVKCYSVHRHSIMC